MGMAGLGSTWRRAPGFVVAIVLALGLGVAAVSTVWALIEAIVLRPVPVPAGERLLQVHRSGASSASLSLPDVIALRERLRGIDAVGMAVEWSLDWQTEPLPRKLEGGLTESTWFRLLEVSPLHGRLFEPGDDVRGAEAVTVLGEAFWRTHFRADPAVIGQSLRLSGVSTRIVGVVPDSVDLEERGIQLWVTTPAFAPWALSSPGSNNLEAIARLAPGVTLAAARAELNTVVQALIDGGVLGDHKRLELTPLRDHLAAASRPALGLMAGLSGLLLLLAVVNCAALLLVRIVQRGEELRVRQALGAGVSALFRLLLREALWLGVLGGVLGWGLALLAFQLLQHLAGDILPRLALGTPGWTLGLCALATTLLTSLVLSLLATRQVLRRSAPGTTARVVGAVPQRLLGSLIGIEVAVAVLLLTGSALLLRSVWALSRVELGFEPQQALSAGLVLPEAGYGALEPQSQAVQRIVADLADTPGVASAAFVVGLPLHGGGSIGHSFLLEGLESSTGSNNGVRFRPFHGDYFATAGIDLRAGRAVHRSDLAPGERVAWVNEAFVRRWLPGREAIGQRVAWTPGEAGPAEAGPQWMRIVGVVADTRTRRLQEADEPAVYTPYLQREDTWIRFGQLLVRLEPGYVAPADLLARSVARVDPGIALPGSEAWASRVAAAARPDRLNLHLALAFAVIALLLSVQGIASMVAYAVASRQREAALRLALGARHAQLRRQQIGAGMRWVGVGVIGGILIGLPLAGLAESLLFGVSATDPLSYASVAGVVLLGGVLACWWPARRLERIAPAHVLKGV